MKYIENPKTKGSGIICCIPQDGNCPNNCEDCFFQSGRSYLEPLDENLPNIPRHMETVGRVVRINDGNDSNVNQESVLRLTRNFRMKFFNTSIPNNLEHFRDPVVLTVNPGEMTNKDYHKLKSIPKNLMFVRFRTNTWNLELCSRAIDYYSMRNVPIILTFMAYFTGKMRPGFEHNYVFRKRTLNSYNAITTEAWERVMSKYKYNKWVHSCGKIEGEKGDTHCRFCGNCLREYYATMEKMRKS